MAHASTVGERATTAGDVKYNDAILLQMRNLLPDGMLGIAIAGLLASFMAGMAANISASNTVFSYDLWQQAATRHRSRQRGVTGSGTWLAGGHDSPDR